MKIHRSATVPAVALALLAISSCTDASQQPVALAGTSGPSQHAAGDAGRGGGPGGLAAFGLMSEFASAGKAFGGNLVIDGCNGPNDEGESYLNDVCNPPRTRTLIGPVRLRIDDPGDRVWITTMAPYSSAADNSRMLFTIHRDSPVGPVIAQSVDTESQGGFDTNTMTAVDHDPLQGGGPREVSYYLTVTLFFGKVTFPATGDDTEDFSEFNHLIQVPDLEMTAAEIEGNRGR